MQDLQGLSVDNFINKANVIVSKVEVDTTGLGDYQAIDVKKFNISSNINNIFQKSCSVSFNFELPNEQGKYSFYDEGAEYYNYIRQGRKVKLYIGINISGNDYYWTWLYGIIDKPKSSYSEKGETWKVNGNDYIAYLNQTSMKRTWWGDSKKYDIIVGQEEYDLESDCKGIYRAFLDKDNKDGTSFKEIYHNSEWTYDWDINKFYFLYPSIPDFSGIGCLWIYYFTEQTVENIVADILWEAGLLTAAERPEWLANEKLCIPTGKKISRVYFNSGIKYLRALELISEVVLYRFYINGEGKPCFKPIPGLSNVIRRVDDTEYIMRSIEERIDELYNDITIIGEKREMKRKWLSVKAYTSIHNLTSSSATIRGSVTEDADNIVTKRGFKWNKIGEAEESWEESGSFGEGYFEHNITGLDADSEYRFCATAEDNQGKKKQSVWVYFKTEEAVS